MLKPEVEKVLNQQLNMEYYSSYLYLSMQAHFESLNLSGFANWMSVQAKEEMTHFTKLYNYILERGSKVTLTAIDGPKTDWDSPLAVFKDGYAHEQKVTASFNNIMEIAREARDNATQIFCEWFITEQVEEEANADNIVSQLEFAKDAPGALLMLDRELAQRVFVDATAGA